MYKSMWRWSMTGVAVLAAAAAIGAVTEAPALAATQAGPRIELCVSGIPASSADYLVFDNTGGFTSTEVTNNTCAGFTVPPATTTIEVHWTQGANDRFLGTFGQDGHMQRVRASSTGFVVDDVAGS